MMSLWTLTGVVFWFTSSKGNETSENKGVNLELNAGFPLRSCNIGYYKKRRHEKKYHLRLRAARRPKERPPIREPVPTWWKPMTWSWPGRRQTPVPKEATKESWWSWFFTSRTDKTKQKRTQKRPVKNNTRSRSVRSKKRRQRPARDKTRDKEWDHTFGESEQRQKYEYAQIKHRLLHQSWIMFDMQFGVSIEELIGDIDPSRQFRMIKQLGQLGLSRREPIEVKLATNRVPKQQSSALRYCFCAMANFLDEERVVKPTMKNNVGGRSQEFGTRQQQDIV
jgi:hypothetical protein